jgi:2-polyprenyl-6-methoxyphenol hydroxylase-like FAD-dependent oxidoreductase
MLVVIAEGGRTGLTLAGELALAGVDVDIVERRASQDLIGALAEGLHSRTIEVPDHAEFRSGSSRRPASAGRGVLPDSSGQQRLPHAAPLRDCVWQNEIERILADWVNELACRSIAGVR